LSFILTLNISEQLSVDSSVVPKYAQYNTDGNGDNYNFNNYKRYGKSLGKTCLAGNVSGKNQKQRYRFGQKFQPYNCPYQIKCNQQAVNPDDEYQETGNTAHPKQLGHIVNHFSTP
jgi:hypothetical protein